MKNKFLNLFIIVLMLVMSFTVYGSVEEYNPSNNSTKEITSEESQEKIDEEHLILVNTEI